MRIHEKYEKKKNYFDLFSWLSTVRVGRSNLLVRHYKSEKKLLGQNRVLMTDQRRKRA